MTEAELKTKIYRKKTVGSETIANPRGVSSEKVSEANSIVSNLMGYILAKHS